MSDANEGDETVMRELNDLFISDSDETREEQERFSHQEEAATDDIPPSLISYFETSRSRAAVCEKLILEEPEDFTTSYDDMMNLPVELRRVMGKLNEQGVSETGNENSTSTDSCLLHDPTDTEALVTHNVEVCPNSEDETETAELMENEKHLTLKVSIPKTSVIEKEKKETSENQREHTEKQRFEGMKKEEQIRRREKDFQEELKKLIDAEKLHQMELQLMEKRAQEKLEQELLLQQELISNLQKQVEEERRMMEEEMKRIKEEDEKKRKEKEEKKKREEEDRKKQEEEKIKRQQQIERMEEEMKKLKEEEENRKIKEMKAEEERRKKEEQRKKEEEDKKREEEEKNRMEKEMRKKEEERKIEERKNEIRLKEKERRRQMEEEERRNKEKEIKIKEKGKNKERDQEEETVIREEVVEVTGKKMEEDKKRKNEEEIMSKDDWRKEEWATSVEEDKTKEEEVRITKELEMRTHLCDSLNMEKKEGERKGEEERSMAAIEKNVDEQAKKREEKRQIQLSQHKEKGTRDMVRRRSIENKCIRKEEKIKKEEECKKGHEEEIRQKEEKDAIQINTDIQKYSKMEDEIRLKEKEGNKTYEAEIRQVDHERKTEKERRHEQEKEKLEKDGIREGGGINTVADEMMMEEVSENKEGTIKTEEQRLKEDEESKMIIVQETEKEARLKRANELRRRREEKNQEKNSINSQNERKNRAGTGLSLTSQLEDNNTWTSLGPGPSHSDSTSFETVQQGDQDKNINKTIDQRDPAVKLCTSPSSLLLCLPEHTEQKRLCWMKDCVPWSKLSLQNRRKEKVSVRTQRFPRRAAEASGLPPLCPDTLLQSTGCKSLQEVTTVTLEDLPGCNLSSLVQCTQLRSLTLRHCGLKSLEGISHLSELCYIDVEENEISFINCENMTHLRVLRLGQNKLTSIHGLSGTDNLDVLELSHNNITRVAGLDSMRRLQKLSVDHNQLISTKGLRDVYTLLHLNCSHNHLASVEGLENCALLNTLDLTANSLTEPPSLDNHVLLRELRLDDNSISSLQGLSACWLPLVQHLSVAQNRITQLPSMSDFVSLANLDLRFNCMSELQNVCESLEGCQFLLDIHLTGNPLQEESGWRSTLQRALPGLKAIDDQDTDSFLSPPAVQHISFASVSFLTFCQAQLQQIDDLQQQHSRELSKASSSLDAIKSFCQHFTETLKLAEDQRFAHEYGDITVSAGQTALEKRAAMESTNAQNVQPADISSRNDIKCNYWTFEEKSSTENWPYALDIVTTTPKAGLHSLTTKEKTSSSNVEMAALSNHQDLDLKNSAAVVIQLQWRKYRQKCGNINGPPAAEKGGRSGGDGGNLESGPFCINRSVVDQHDAATVIQAFWRGCSVRRRLTSALAAVTCPSSREDDTFEEVDVDEFVFDEAALEKPWTLQFSEASSSRHDLVSEQPLSLKFPGSFPDPSQYTLPPPPPAWRPKQAWVAGEEVDSAGQRVSPESSQRKYPASTSVLSGVSERSEKILEEWGFTDSHTALLMLKRAQKMKSKQQPKKKHGDPSVHLALFRNCHYQLGPVEARNRPSPHSRNHQKVCKAELGRQQAERTEQMKQEGAQQWLHTQSERRSESEHFLPEISSDILNGGRVQLVCVQADPTHTEQHHTSGLWANNSLAAQPGKQNSSPHRISLGHARKDVPSPRRVTSAPSKKERISFRDIPVQLSGGWGGGKKREKVHK